jgi:hypothetical protein
VAVGAAAALGDDGGVTLGAEDAGADCWLFPVVLAVGVVASTAVVVAGAIAAALFEAEGPAASGSVPAAPAALGALLTAGAAAVSAGWAALVVAVVAVFWLVAAVAGDELAGCPVVEPPVSAAPL